MELSSDFDIVPVLWSITASTSCLQAARSAQDHLPLKVKHGGSRVGKARNRDIGRLSAAQRLDIDYFGRTGRVRPAFSNESFERRFRMPREVFESSEQEYCRQMQDTLPKTSTLLGSVVPQQIKK
jgi:hypothetical protein